uniref:tRNA-splicing endonuclease subunit Sen54 N-terminal domain-containing protein n=1 Tax=Lygus hesperus TaxID=30085 RepID=A0A0K8TFY1_LYGHE
MLQNRSNKLLSGKDVINLKNSSLKDIPSGSKEYAPNNSWLESKQIQVTLETYHDLVRSERIEKKANLSSAIWLDDVGKAKVTKKAGKFWEVFGHTIDSEDWLLPEEALFLLETNALELFREGVPLSIEETYSLVVGDHCSLEEYRVYSHLSRKGYRVLRHDKEITLTAYEKEIHLDQINLAEKRCAPSTSVASKVDSAVGKELDGMSVTEVAAEDKPGADVPEVAVNQAEKVKESPTPTEDASKGEKSNADSIGGDAKDDESIRMSEEASSERNTGDSLVSAEDGAKRLLSSEVQDKEKDVGTKGNANCGVAPSLVVDISLDTDEKEASPDVEMHDEPEVSERNTLAVSDLVPLKKRVGSSPDLLIVEDEQDDVIEIDDDDNEDGDIHEVEITEVKTASHNMDTVDLMDSEEDDDVVFICQKSGNKDPSKWRKWFSTIPVFVNTVFPEENDQSNQKPSKLKLIDLFDLGNKTIDTIMKAIPRHDGSANFINAPDLRFIPQNIVPKFAHYRINVQTYDSTLERDDAHSVQSDSATPVGNVDTSQSLSQVVQYGQEPANFSRNPYGYSFHRTRNNNYRRNLWNPQNQNNGFQRQPFRPNRFNPSDHSLDSSSPVIPSIEGTNQSNFKVTESYNNRNDGVSNRNGRFNSRNNDYNNRNDGYNNHHEGFVNQDRRNYASNASQSFTRPNHFRGRWDNNQNNFQNNFVNDQNPAPFGGFQQNNNGMQGQLKFALQQACQMQMLAMNLMQNSQALIQNFNSPQMNFMNPMNNFQVANNFNPTDLVSPFINQFKGDFRGRRPYRRPYMRRGSGGRRRYFNNDRGSPNVSEVSEVVCIDSDEEECKVKQKPAYKRMLALGAIADLNSPKRSKIISITEVEDVKPGRSVKRESRLSAEKSRAEVALVKNERLPTKAEPVSSGNVCKTEERSVSETIPSTLYVSAKGSVNNPGVTGRSTQSPVSICDESTNSSTVELVDEESASGSGAVMIESAPASTPDCSIAPEVQVTDVVMEEGQNEVNSELKADEAATNSEIVTSDKEVPVTWKSYKQGLTESPIQSKTFSSLLSYEDQRASVKDVLKSLQIFDPIEETESTKELIKVSFDVYLPNQPFRKSVRLLPNYRVIVKGSSWFPSVYELNYLNKTYKDDVPFLYAVVYADSIGIYNLHSVTLPTLVDNM